MGADSSRSGLGAPALIIVVLAALGLGPSLFGPKAPTPNQSSTETATPAVAPPNNVSASEEVPGHSAAALLENFFDTNTTQVNDRPWSRGDHPSTGEARVLTGSRAHFQIDFLVASLPEPGSPPLRSQFDADLDAISFAVGRDGYSLANFDLPWIDDASKSGPSSSDSALAGKGSRSRTEPGVMLFYREAKEPQDFSRLLVMMIVGESPTRGVNPTALRDALDQIAWLSGWKPGKPSAPAYLSAMVQSAVSGARQVRVIGPSFSGSAISIRNVLEEWSTSFASNPPQARIVSGAATAIADELTSTNPPVDFVTLRVPDKAAIPILRSHFLPHGITNPPVVLLTENTTYGASFAQAGRSKSAHGGSFAGGFLKIPFPLHISDLRTASGKQSVSASSDATQQLIGRNLPLPDETAQQVRDVVPAFSERSAVYNQLVLENLLATIRAERARYVGVVATDVEDLVFLVRQIRANCPDVTVFTTSADLLYTHSDFLPDLAGMQVFSTYPLFFSEQAWTNPDEGTGRRLQFPTEDSEGVYNATMVQLGHPDWMLDYGLPFGASGADSMVSAGKADPGLPVLWLSVVGRDGLWPLDFIAPEKSMDHVLSRGTTPASGQINLGALYPITFQIASMLLTVLCLLPCIAFLAAPRAIASSPSGTARPLWDLMTGKSVFADLRAERELRVAAFIGALLIAYLVGLGVYLLPLRMLLVTSEPSRLWPLLRMPVAIIGCFALMVATPLMVLAFIAACRRIGGWPSFQPVPDTEIGTRRYSVQPTLATVAFAGTLIGIGLVILFVVSLWMQSLPGTFFAFIRAVNLGNRVSPLMPLIFLGAANLCLIGGDLWRLRLLEDGRITLPFLAFDEAESFRGVGILEERVVDALECPPWRLTGWWFLILLLACGFIYFAVSKGRWVYPMDGRFFDVLFFASAPFIYLYFSILLLRFLQVWNALHRLLRRLYWHPSRGAYEGLRVSTLPGRPEDQRLRLIEPQPSLTATEYCLERAREILLTLADHPAVQALTGPITAAVAQVESHLARFEKSIAESDWDDQTREMVRIRRAMATLSGLLVKMAEPLWRLQNGQTPPRSLNADEEKLRELTNLFVASRVVDFLRQIFPQLANLAGVAMTGVLAMMLALSVYPFVQRDTLVWLSWAVLLTVIALCFTVFVQINRSRIISFLMGTTPGRFNWDGAFSVQLLIYGVLPILTLLGAQYPHTFGGVVSWASGLLSGGK
ncbi:MAG TPA: hypothetical protein VMT61_01535 [Candidatus Binataceae bacterium]|nr:hypothetical protein [Candidatus Binataceae bacterium]